MLEAVTCPICDEQGEMLVSPEEITQELDFVVGFYGKRVRKNSDQTDQTGFVQRDITGIEVCNPCNAIFRNPAPSPEEIYNRYKDEKYDRNRLEFFLRVYEKAFLSRLDSLRDELPKDPRILEVGSYAGGFLSACKSRGINNVQGLDICLDIVNFLQSKGFNVSSQSLNTFASSQKRELLDCICIWNCFDQLPSPHQDLEIASSLLKKGGKLVLRFPNGELYKLLHLSPQAFLSRSRIAKALMAYNNLAGFTFRNGYSLSSIKKIIENLPLRITAVNGTQLISINEASNMKSWARVEERLVRRMTKLVSKSSHLSPWLEITLTKE